MSASAPSAAVRLRRPRWLSALEGIRRPYTVLALYGLAAGSVIAIALLVALPHEWSIMGSRATGMRASLAVLGEGGPLLVGRHGPTGAYYPVALGDDPGTFTYFPLLGHLLGGVDPVVVLRYFYVVAVAALTALYPIMFYGLTRSLLAGLAAPLMLVVCLLAIGPIDIYWIPAWGMLALLPSLYLLARRWPRLGLLALVAIALAAGWLSSIRSSAGLGILIIAAIVLLLRRWRWWRVLPAVALLAVAYMTTSTFVFTAIREHRDQRLGVKMMTDDEMTQHPLYHTAYIGLGYLHNDYGIRFRDEVAAARVQKEAPGTPYFSHHYETVIQRAYFDFVRAHPLEVLRQYGAKAVVAVADTGPYLLLVLLTLPAMLLLGPARRETRLWSLLTIPALLVGLLQPMVAIPEGTYDGEVFGVLGVLGILGLCWVLARAEAGARERGGLSPVLTELRVAWATHPGRHDPLRRSVRISVAAVAVLALFCTCGYFIRENAFRWQGSQPSTLQRYLGSVESNAPVTPQLHLGSARDDA
jgi:hypothetical protein